MSYLVTILRTAAGRLQPITQEEVRAAIAPMVGRLAVYPDGKEFMLYRPGLGDESEILILTDGELWAKNPGEQLLELMIELAE